MSAPTVDLIHHCPGDGTLLRAGEICPCTPRVRAWAARLAAVLGRSAR